MAGWNLTKGVITEYSVSEDRIWSLFNFLFSDSSRKRNTYKFGFLKSILDNVFNGIVCDEGVFFSYKEIFSKFAENYWNLVVKYDLRQMRPDGRSVYSRIETILKTIVEQNSLLGSLEFDALDELTKDSVIRKVISECKKNVIGALYEDFEGTIYSFDLKSDGIYINNSFYVFMQKYKFELEKLNYYSWAKFLESVNSDAAVVRLLDKLELATPKRNNLAVYREILKIEFEYNTCFYCGKKLRKTIHVDHFIPWSFVKDDKLWNFVLACPRCNERKSNKVAPRDYIIRLENRNKRMMNLDNKFIRVEFESYSDGLIDRMWEYAKLSGFKEFDRL